MREVLNRTGVDVWLPGGIESGDAVGRTTDLGIGAHPDDLEFFAPAPIGECLADDARWFTGVTCTTGAGSERSGRFVECSDGELVVLRREEQRRAAELGCYSAMVQLGYSSVAIRAEPGGSQLVDDLEVLLAAARPSNVYTHDLADRHATHVAVGLAVIEAVRRLPLGERPARVVGCEGWRSLDWLPEEEKVRLDVTDHVELADRLAAVFETQLEGKRYDRAEQGRRRANATLSSIRSPDAATEVTLAMDLTPLIRNEDLDPAVYIGAAVERFRAEASDRIQHRLA